MIRLFPVQIIIAVTLVVMISINHSAFAQTSSATSLDVKLLKLDDTLTPTISTTLTALSLTGASFLVSVSRLTATGSDEEKKIKHVSIARRSFIKAFYMFLLCTIFLFIFDFIEILDSDDVVKTTILDVIISYSLFGLGIFCLTKAARQLYASYGR